MAEHRFGGDWTEIKLLRIEKYLRAYTTIFAAHSGAQHYTTVYVDAFAGTGYFLPKKSKGKDDQTSVILPEFAEPETQEFLKGSAQRALATEPEFDHYVFVEQNAEYAAELQRLRNLNYEMRYKIEVVSAEANQFLSDWCARQDWDKQRAVVFLDPYALEVTWHTIEILGKTKGIDLWLLWPIGQAINRLLTKNQRPSEQWADALTLAFGTEDWASRFYTPAQPIEQTNLFGESEPSPVTKTATFREIEKFFIERLQTVFGFVAPNPLYLYNSRNVPLYLLCFASNNATGMNIAKDILSK